jgi:hypothetical protein
VPSRRQVLLSVAASPLVAASLSSVAVVLTRWFEKKTLAKGPVSSPITQARRVAIFSVPSTESRALAQACFHSARLEGYEAQFYCDMTGLSKLQTGAEKVDFQLKGFNSVIAELEKNPEQYAFFSFRNLYRGSRDKILSELHRMNFQLIFVEPTDPLESSLNWSLLYKLGISPTHQGVKPDYELAPRSVRVEFDHLRFISRIFKRMKVVRERVYQLGGVRMSESKAVSYLGQMNSPVLEMTWRNSRIKNVFDVISNRDELELWRSQRTSRWNQSNFG